MKQAIGWILVSSPAWIIPVIGYVAEGPQGLILGMSIIGIAGTLCLLVVTGLKLLDE